MIKIRNNLDSAMKEPDSFAVAIIYVTQKKVSLRVVSPIKWVSTQRFSAFDLCREEFRLFRITQIWRCRLVNANLVSAGHPIIETEVE